MKHSDFQVGQEFRTGSGRWRCTDIGTRTIAAIRLDKENASWYSGPPYAVMEHIFDEHDQEGCFKAEAIRDDEIGTAIEKHRSNRDELQQSLANIGGKRQSRS